MKKILHVILALTLCLGLATVSFAQIQPRYTDISSILGSAKAVSSTQIYCGATLNAHSDQDLEIELIVTDENGNEVKAVRATGFGGTLKLSKYITVAAGGTYTCEFYFTCGADSPVITRTVRT